MGATGACLFVRRMVHNDSIAGFHDAGDRTEKEHLFVSLYKYSVSEKNFCLDWYNCITDVPFCSNIVKI